MCQKTCDCDKSKNGGAVPNNNNNNNNTNNTTVDIRGDLIQEREALRIRLAEIQQQHAYNIQIIKNNIVSECEIAIVKTIF